MKLILHVGMAKSGSTALQRGLHALQDRLLEHGYLYPTGKKVRHNHIFLVAAMEPPGVLPRFFPQHYRTQPEAAARDLGVWLDDIRRQLARRRPKVLLMSGEGLFRRCRPEQIAKLAAVLRPLADEIEVVAYLRKPSEFYLASTQQTLHADYRIRPVAPIAYRAPLEGYAAIADRLHVFRYDRADFPGGDVLRHFLETFCPEVPVGTPPPLEANVSLSAEAMAILADYHRLHHADARNRFFEDASRVRLALGAADGALPANRRARLKPELARSIDEGSDDLLWLRDTHGIVFDGVDYARIAPMAAPRAPERLDEVCVIDAARTAALTLHAFRHLADPAAAPRPASAEPDKPRRIRARRAARRRGKPGAEAGSETAAVPGRVIAMARQWRAALRPLLGARRP